MDEMTKVRELRSEAPTPDRARLAQGRMRLVDAAEGGGSAWRMARLRRDWRLAAAGAALAVAASAVIAVNVADSSGGSDPGPRPAASQTARPGTAQEFLEAAARAAESVKGAEPREDQWYYTKHIGASVERDTGELGKSTTDEDWFTAGSQKGEESDWTRYYALLKGLPDDPEGIVKAYQKAYPNQFDMLDPKKPADVFYIAQALARSPITPLEGEGQAKLYRALAKLPGIGLVDRPVTDAAGRETVGITLKPGPDDRYRNEMLMLPDTYQVVGSRMVVARDFTDNNEETAFFPGTWKAGDVMTTSADLVLTFVDEKNARP
ncbi:hypothetical protein G6045_25955 [Streptomyces sp. YC504]|uniref:CU044_5270 family protein n=1 Tax=Streptomyces mesophilus TaxID=1775132 RepID=A0A6G4XPF2_9ACTN|nr:hypothetical protein [Streptomyces mesophilus]NGO79072.1 hypothetical protein [Streptomyces mesophilus]